MVLAARSFLALHKSHGNRKIPAPKFFMESDACERCHQDIFRQWQEFLGLSEVSAESCTHPLLSVCCSEKSGARSPGFNAPARACVHRVSKGNRRKAAGAGTLAITLPNTSGGCRIVHQRRHEQINHSAITPEVILTRASRKGNVLSFMMEIQPQTYRRRTSLCCQSHCEASIDERPLAVYAAITACEQSHCTYPRNQSQGGTLHRTLCARKALLKTEGCARTLPRSASAPRHVLIHPSPPACAVQHAPASCWLSNGSPAASFTSIQKPDPGPAKEVQC